MIYLAILIIPLLIPFIAKLLFHNKICWKELGINALVVVLFVTICYMAGAYSQAWDNEIWNGEVTTKKSVRVSCEHSYSCRCRTVSCGKDCTTTHCDTCYEHFYDINWNLYTSIGETITINRINRQGTQEPPRFTKATTGDPVAIKKSYLNYIKAAPDSLFNFDKILDGTYPVPTYPLGIYDYHYVNRVIPVGVDIPDIDKWNYGLAKILNKLGPSREANIILIFTKHDPKFYFALRNKWLGGKKNDVVVVIGTSQYPKIDWVEVMSWTNNELYKIQLRDDLLSLGSIDFKILDTINTHTIKDFKRRDMTEFDYLKDEIEPPTWLLILTFILGTGISLGLAWFFHRNNTFPTQTNFGNFRRRR